MIRKLLLVAFVLSATGNSLAGVLPYIAGEGECEGNCCRIVRRSESRANQSKITGITGLTGLRCLMQCEHPVENQGVPESPLLRTERYSKTVALVAPGIPPGYSTLNARTPHSASRTAVTSIQLYLKTGTLLI